MEGGGWLLPKRRRQLGGSGERVQPSRSTTHMFMFATKYSENTSTRSLREESSTLTTMRRYVPSLNKMERHWNEILRF